jgi:hypothetical protein
MAPKLKWTIGFWYWADSSVPQHPEIPIDTIFFHAGSLVGPQFAGQWQVEGLFPEDLPKAREYWATIRYERQSVPKKSAVRGLLTRIVALRSEAERIHLHLTGVQLDIDSPTRSLPEYAAFLQEVRRGLPPGLQLSITALLDWFRDGTAIADVVAQVDEFVPQFYDVGETIIPRPINFPLSRHQGISAIAAKVDAAEWAPRFNKFAKRYRIGISTFGRADFITPNGTSVYGDLSPLTIGSNPAFTLQVEHNPFGEAIVKYRAKRNIGISYNRITTDDVIQFVLPTPESASDAYASAKQFGGYCGGVLFFRWPVSDEDITLRPAEVLNVIGVVSDSDKAPHLSVVDGGCVSVDCVDLRISNINGHSPVSLRYTITSTTPIEYFLPEKDITVRLSTPKQLEFILPPFAMISRILIGRVATGAHSELSIKTGEIQP